MSLPYQQIIRSYLMKVPIYTLLFLLFIACDPVDDRLRLHNNTSQPVLATFMFDETWSILKNDSSLMEKPGLTEVSPDEKQGFQILTNWETEYDRVAPDSMLKILVMEYFDEVYHPHLFQEHFKRGNYYMAEYTLEDLKRMKWLIEYPNDGFQEVNKRMKN